MFLSSLVIYPSIIFVLLLFMKSNNLNAILLLERFLLYYVIALISTLVLKNIKYCFIILKNKTVIKMFNVIAAAIFVIMLLQANDIYYIYYWAIAGVLIPISSFITEINYRNND